MNLSHKLRLIQEGYSINEINSGELIPPFNESSFDAFSLFIENISSDIDYITNMNVSILQENNKTDKESIFKKVIELLIGKIRQFKYFVMNLFKRKKQELTEVHMARLERLLVEEFKPYTISNTLEKIIKSPNESINSLKSLLEKFEDNLVERFESAYGGYGNGILRSTTLVDLKIFIWKNVMKNSSISYDNNVSENVIDHILDKKQVVQIESRDHIKNIVVFGEGFYDLWKEINHSLTFYEHHLQKLDTLTDESFRVIRLICQTMLNALPEVLKYVDSHIAKLISIGGRVT